MKAIGINVIRLAMSGNTLAIDRIAEAIPDNFTGFKVDWQCYSCYPYVFTYEPCIDFYRLANQFISACYLYRVGEISESLFRKKGERLLECY